MTRKAPKSYAAIYDAIFSRIVQGQYRPIHRIGIATLAQALGVSTTPVREALQRLEEDGLVRIFPQSKTVVARIDEAQLKEVHFLRVAIETEVARRMAEKGDMAALKRARSFVRMQEALQDDPSQMLLFNELDRAFHLTKGNYFPLAGPEASGGGRLPGPFLYYLLAIPLLIKSSYDSIFIFHFILNVGSLLTFFLFAWKHFQFKTAVLALILFSLDLSHIGTISFPINPVFIFAFIILFMHFFLKFMDQRKL